MNVVIFDAVSVRAENNRLTAELATLRRELAVAKRALDKAMQHNRFSGDCPAECDEVVDECWCSASCDSDGSACWGKWFTAQAAAEMEKEAGNGQD